MTKEEIFEKIKEEASSYVTNFFGIDILNRLEDDFYAAKYQDYNMFSICPNQYYILSEANQECEDRKEPYCPLCWKKAIEAKVRGEI